MKIKIPREIPRDVTQLKYLLEESGPLAKLWPEFEPRKEQQRMFLEVLRSFKHGDVSIIEAGTGTGKTLAYLLPALLSGKKTMVSTGLKNLQEQILNKDLKFISDFFDMKFKAVLLKGRENYLCLRNFSSLQRRMSKSESAGEAYKKFSILQSWVIKTETGELSELPGAQDGSFGPFARLSSSREICDGRNCSENKDCFVTRARARAAEADIVLVNHYLLLADLSLREIGHSILPEYEAIVIDEAHLLEGVATQSFTKTCSIRDLQKAIEDLNGHLDRIFNKAKEKIDSKDQKFINSVMELLDKVNNHCIIILNNLQTLKKDTFLWPKPEKAWEKQNKEFKQYLSDLYDPVKNVSDIAKVIGEKDEEAKPVSLKLIEFSENLFFILDGSDSSYVYQVKASDGDVIFDAIPIIVGPYLGEGLFSKNKTTILTSATMAVNESMDYFKDSVGIKKESTPLILPSPFDFKNNTILYVPGHLPDPSTDRARFNEAIIPELEKLLNITRGRAMVLFTALDTMKNTHEALSKKLRFPVYRQGLQYNKDELLKIFMRQKDSILMATKSFWQGVDVPGESLSAVIIDKLPFPNPDLPVNEGKKNYLEASKKNWFMEFYVPDATIQLKQGLGRLIRAKTDKGLMAILDPRLTRKPYGPKIMNSLPPGSRTQKIEDVRNFFLEKGLI
jgi:ATP-dependent DNA helicase DinG